MLRRRGTHSLRSPAYWRLPFVCSRTLFARVQISGYPITKKALRRGLFCYGSEGEIGSQCFTPTRHSFAALTGILASAFRLLSHSLYESSNLRLSHNKKKPSKEDFICYGSGKLYCIQVPSDWDIRLKGVIVLLVDFPIKESLEEAI